METSGPTFNITTSVKDIEEDLDTHQNGNTEADLIFPEEAGPAEAGLSSLTAAINVPGPSPSANLHNNETFDANDQAVQQCMEPDITGQTGLDLYEALQPTDIPILLNANTRRARQPGERLRCSIEGCNICLSTQPDYYQRYRICKEHLRSPFMQVEGSLQRFCQQCGKFHPLQNFDQLKRNCRARLAQHNSRRRKAGRINGALGIEQDKRDGDRGLVIFSQRKRKPLIPFSPDEEPRKRPKYTIKTDAGVKRRPKSPDDDQGLLRHLAMAADMQNFGFSGGDDTGAYDYDPHRYDPRLSSIPYNNIAYGGAVGDERYRAPLVVQSHPVNNIGNVAPSMSYMPYARQPQVYRPQQQLDMGAAYAGQLEQARQQHEQQMLAALQQQVYGTGALQNGHANAMNGWHVPPWPTPPTQNLYYPPSQRPALVAPGPQNPPDGILPKLEQWLGRQILQAVMQNEDLASQVAAIDSDRGAGIGRAADEVLYALERIPGNGRKEATGYPTDWRGATNVNGANPPPQHQQRQESSFHRPQRVRPDVANVMKTSNSCKVDEIAEEIMAALTSLPEKREEMPQQQTTATITSKPMGGTLRVPNTNAPFSQLATMLQQVHSASAASDETV